MRGQTDMAMGPVEYIIVSFPGNKFSGEMVPELAALIDSRTVRILDLVFVRKDADGNVDSLEFDQLDELAPYADIDGDVGGLAGPEDIEHAAALLEPNSSAALLIWEDLWALPLVEAIRNSGGVLVEGARVPRELVEEAFEELESAG
jgi:hypothetical protein